MGFGLLEDRRKDVADVRFVPLRALNVEDRGLQNVAKRDRLLGLPLFPAALMLDRFVEEGIDRGAQRRQIRTAGGENALGLGLVEKGVEKVLECDVRMPTRHRFAEREMKHDFKRG